MLGGYLLSSNQLSSKDGTRGDILGFYPSVLSPGQRYAFRLEVVSASGVGWSDIAVKFREAPLGGIFDVVPRIGYSVDTEFRLSAVGWIDDVENLPLR